MEKKSKILIAVIAAVAVVVIAVAIILAFGVLGGGSFSNQVERGESYLESGDYDKAIEAFKKAIEADDTDEDAYIGLATAYHSNALFALAKQTLSEGLLHVDSVRMRTLMEEWFGISNDNIISVGDKGDMETTAPTEAETASVETEPAGDPGVTYNTCTLQGRVVDAINGDGLGNVSVKVYSGNTESGTPDVVVTDGTGKYSIEVSSGNHFVIVEKLGYNRSAEPVFISPASSKTYYDVEIFEEGANLITGRVIDAATGFGIPDAVVTAYGVNGSEVTQTTSNSSGDYKVAVRGYESYYISVEADGYITENIEIYPDANNLKINRDITMSEKLADDQIRIVLTWGDSPIDLDSYLSGNASDGTSTFIKFSHRSETDRSGQKIAELDLDDRNGYGPETTTVYDIYGDYEFYVVDYYVTETLAERGATVKVYRGDSLVHTIEVASDVVNVWDVLRIRNGNVEVTNCAKDIVLTPGSK